jgi:hypothetical protein
MPCQFSASLFSSATISFAALTCPSLRQAPLHFGWEEAFHFIWQNAGRDGIWCGDEVSLAKEFDALEDDAESVLDELREKRLIEKLDARTYFLSNWREKDDPGLHDQ